MCCIKLILSSKSEVSYYDFSKVCKNDQEKYEENKTSFEGMCDGLVDLVWYSTVPLKCNVVS